MTKSLVRKLIDAKSIQSDFTATEIHPQRIVDERGAFQVEVSADPEAGSSTTSATVELRGRVTTESGVSVDVITTVNLTDLEGLAAYPASKVIADVQILPHMDAKLNGDAGADAVTVSAWLME